VKATRLRLTSCMVTCFALLLAAGCGGKHPAEAQPAPGPEPSKPAVAETAGTDEEAANTPSEPTAPEVKAVGDAVIVDAVYVVVDKEVITYGDIVRRVEPIVTTMLKGRETPSQDELNALRARVFAEIAYGMITKALILKAAREQGLTVDEARVGSQINRLLLNEGVSLDDYLVKNKLTYRELYREVQDDVLFAAFRQMRIVPRVIVTPGEIRAYFEAHKAEFSTPEQVHCHQIVIFGNSEEKKAKVQAAIEKLHAGADFSEVAKEFSESSTAGNGGDMGWVSRDVLSSEAVNHALFDQLKVGEVSDVIEDEQGFLWIVMVSGRREAKEASLDDAWGDIERRLRRIKIEQETVKYARQIAKTTSILPEQIRQSFLSPPEEQPE
jgi:peptidyl-prolyl cis-trans isomerase SurA